VLSLALLPPQHVHVAHTGDGHHTGVVHRHVEAHQPVNPVSPVPVSPVSHDARFDHDEDEEVAWLDDSSFIGARPASPQPTLVELLNERPEPAPLEQMREGAVRTVRASVHDPPWLPATALRAPPASRL
jgi:hypothetical protein